MSSSPARALPGCPPRSCSAVLVGACCCATPVHRAAGRPRRCMPISRATASRRSASSRSAAASLHAYPCVRFAPVEVTGAPAHPGRFFNHTGRSQARRVRARKLLIASGLFDIVPRIPGIDALFGRSVFQCPYCDGWEMRDRKVAVYGRRTARIPDGARDDGVGARHRAVQRWSRAARLPKSAANSIATASL